MQKVVNITFSYFSTERNFDYVQLYDGYNASSRLITSLSWNNLSIRSYYSTQQFMYIIFVTDATIVYNGFNASFQSVNQQGKHEKKYFFSSNKKSDFIHLC
jgi:CUB domain